MSTNQKTEESIAASVLAAVRSGKSNVQVGREYGLNESTVRRIKLRAVDSKSSVEVPGITYFDKKQGGFNWRDALAPIQQMQKFQKSASWSQSTATVRIGDGSNPVGLLCWGDQHIGAKGTDYNLFLEMTNLLLETDSLFALLTGDLNEWAVKLRGVSEVCAQILDPALQVMFIESWIDEIKHKVVASSFGNHTDDRSEAAIGMCPVRAALAKHIPYFSGIGHLELQTGGQSYLIAVAHKFRGVSALDSTAGCKRYLRMEAPTFDAAIQGDCHRAGVSVYNEGGSHRVAISNGTFHLHSGFAQRYFSLSTSSAQPVLALWPQTKRMVPFFNVDQFVATLGNARD